MSKSNQRCLSIEELIVHSNGDLAPPRIAHLSECELCKAALDGIEITDRKVQKTLLEGEFMPEFQAVSISASTPKRRALFPVKWLAAACFIIALGWAGWQYYPTSSPGIALETSPEAFVEQPYRRQMRSAGITTDMYGDAALAFSRDLFIESIDLYHSAIPKAPTDLLRTRGYYELGIAYWKAGNLEDSAEYLTRARVGELDYYEDSTWALAQLYRQMGYLDEALGLYRDLLAVKGSPYVSRAQKMISYIESSDH